jgi:hypothetical protein
MLGPDGKTLYWSTLNSAFRMSVSGGAPRSIYHRERAGVELAGVDEAGVYVTWSQAAQDGGLIEFPADGGPQVSIFTGAPLLYTHLSDEHVAFCTAAVGFVWTKSPYTQKIISEFHGGVCDAVTSDGSLVYWSQGGAVHSSAAPERILVRATAKYLTVRGDHLYWFDESPGIRGESPERPRFSALR